MEGRTDGSHRDSSKFLTMSTVSFSISARRSDAILLRRASVYLMAAAESPSTEPKLPCPSTSVYLSENGCASLTMASYAAVSPWGWYLPRTSPTILADFLCGDLYDIPRSFMAYRILLCTGFRPSRASGRARPIMTDIE